MASPVSRGSAIPVSAAREVAAISSGHVTAACWSASRLLVGNVSSRAAGVKPLDSSLAVRRAYSRGGGSRLTPVEKIDRQILGLLADDGRMSYTDLGQATGCRPARSTSG